MKLGLLAVYVVLNMQLGVALPFLLVLDRDSPQFDF